MQTATIRQKKSGKPGVWGRMKRDWLFYVSISPYFLLFLIFSAFPIVTSFFIGFTQWNAIGKPKFIGLENYIHIFHDPTFLKSIFNTLYIWFFSTLFTLSLAFILAFLVNHYVVRGKGFYRVIYLIPLLVAPALTSIIISILFSTNSGIINAFISLFIEGKYSFDWLGSPFWIKPLIVLLIMWRWTGWHFIIQLAGLQTISNDYYDAAKIDGAGDRQILLHITLPLMLPIILFSVVSATVGGIQLFDEPFVLTNGTGGTLQSATTMGMYLYQTAFQDFKFGLASSMAYVIFFIILVVTLINASILRQRR